MEGVSHRALVALRPHLFPTVQDMAQVAAASAVAFADHLQLRRQSPTTRAVFPTTRGQLQLSLPVWRAHQGTAINDARIDPHTPWVNALLKTLYHHYHFAPYFDFYFTPLEHLLQKPWEKVGDVLLAILTFHVQRFGNTKPLFQFSAQQVHSTEEVKIFLHHHKYHHLICSPEEKPYYVKNFPEFEIIETIVTGTFELSSEIHLSPDQPFLVGVFFQGPTFIKTVLHHTRFQ